MDEYRLLPNEAVLFDNGEGLMLTNLHIIQTTSKGLFKVTKSSKIFPLNQIKVYEGKAQVLLNEEDGIIDVYFLNEKMTFEIDGKKERREFVSKINEVLTGEKLSFGKEDIKKKIPGTKFVAETLKGTVDTVMDVFGKDKEPENKDVRVSQHCISCGAQITGFQGRSASCEYCGTAQQL